MNACKVGSPIDGGKRFDPVPLWKPVLGAGQTQSDDRLGGDGDEFDFGGAQFLAFAAEMNAQGQ
jgi:hypothetical protein